MKIVSNVIKFIFKVLFAPLKHMGSLGFTNRMALYIIGLLLLGLVGGYKLSILSIEYNYTGALMCWTVVFTPIGTACSLVLSKIVQKSIAENTGADGDGIKYAAAKANNFQHNSNDVNTVFLGQESPPI